MDEARAKVAGSARSERYLSVGEVFVRFPEPVTSVEIHQSGATKITAWYQGSQVAEFVLDRSGTPVYIEAKIDGLRIYPIKDALANRHLIVSIQQLCYVKVRDKQTLWQPTPDYGGLNRTGYADQLMLRPNTHYVIEVEARRRERKAGELEWHADAPECLQTKQYYFKTASAPGLNLETSQIDFRDSPVNRLGSYVKRTVPKNGAKLFYSGYDIVVEFNEGYLQALYDGNLTLQVKDRNGRIVLGDAGTWIRGAFPLLTPGLLALLSAPRDRACVDEPRPWQRFIPHHLACTLPDNVRPGRMYQAEVMSAGLVLYTFEFALSRYRDIREHLTGQRASDEISTEPYRPTIRSGLQAIPLPAFDLAGYEVKRSAFFNARSNLNAVLTFGESDAGVTLKQALQDMPRTKDEFNRLSNEHYALMDQALQPQFEAIGLGHRPLPPSTELVQIRFEGRAGVCFLLESPEPIEWQRIQITRDGSTQPMRVFWNDDQTRAFLLDGDSADGLIVSGPHDFSFIADPGGVSAPDLDPLYVRGVIPDSVESINWSV